MSQQEQEQQLCLIPWPRALTTELQSIFHMKSRSRKMAENGVLMDKLNIVWALIE